ncbi:MAG TPA: DUF2937 family protein [Spirochaetota bacterium]|nr:DUF2937 family protein [Spirochaetota bacterium]HPF04911.1 DUF2937 family protein [Spirochaetota bacterium]HPJ40974.1 DUF2937 family protein [Spirochaetota bacterium]HPR37079.1 DUF2937 family protein [Spirochaetota bacterium]HRX46204.1 DUF2937 family protein [Spirochaetota bacterium]
MLKKILIAPFIVIEHIADRAIAAAGAVVFMQIPAFIVQYIQRLGGHVDELKLLIEKYKAAAADSGRPLTEYVQLHIQSGVKEFASTGKLMSENIERFNFLSDAHQQISSASGIKQFFLFISKSDMDIIRGTYSDFVPGISFSVQSVIYAAAGIVLFMSLYFIIKKSITLIFSRFKSKQ